MQTAELQQAGPDRDPLRVALVVALLAAALVAANVHRTHGGDWTGPFLVGEAQARVPGWPLPVATEAGSQGYDGQFFLALAFDPFLRTPLAGVLDDAEYRARRIGWPLTAWLLGAGEDSARIAFLYLLLVAGVAALGYLLADWAVDCGASAWWGLPGALGLGSLVCLQRMLTDALMTAFLVAAAVALARGSRRGERMAALALTLAVLHKEIALLAFPLLALPWLRRRRLGALAWLALPLVVPAAWWLYVDATIAGDGPFSLTIPFSWPLQGLAQGAGEAVGRATGLRLGKDLAFLALHAAAVLLGLWIGWRALAEARRGSLPDGLSLAIGLFAVLGVFLGYAVWIEPWSYARVLLPLLTLELLLGLRDRGSPGSLPARGLALASFAGGLLFALHNLVDAVP